MPIRYEILSERYLEQTLEVLARGFTIDEPLNHVLKFTHFHYKKYLQIYIKKILDRKLSFIAISEDDDRVVGAIAVEDMSDYELHDEEVNAIHPNFAIVNNLLEELEGDYLREHGFSNNSKPSGTHSHWFMGAVDPKNRGQQIFSRLIRYVGELCKSKGYKYAVGEATSEFSFRAMKQIGFRELRSVQYADFVLPDDTKPFLNVPKPHVKASLVVWDLNED